ncbi:MAG: hypothetical protein M1827_000565 [Pycnora praestabilis]|nr:MAG: hypothetical protein M1827_000565 [Pycnora praestabilis]
MALPTVLLPDTRDDIIASREDDNDDEVASEHSGSIKASKSYSASNRSMFVSPPFRYGQEIIDCFSASTKSLTDSVLEYPIENGRRYCNETYHMPNDEAEQTRLSIIHQVYLLLMDGQMTKAPITEDVKRILDVGTGLGDWAIDVAERYPDAQVVATDITAFQPSGGIPSNLSFQIDDAQEEWTYTEVFDLIHMRNLSGAFNDWAGIYQDVCKHLRPGGYIEIVDFDYSQMCEFFPNSYFTIFIGATQAAADKAGTSCGTAHLKRPILEKAGFTDITTTIMDIPVGTWSEQERWKRVGKMWLVSMLETLEGGSLRLLTRQAGWKKEEVTDLIEKVRHELVAEDKRPYTPVLFVVARKPVEES